MKRIIDKMFGRPIAYAARLATLAALGCMLAACGGSGSSGFDGEPAGEPETIGAAVDQGSCLELEAVTYCGSGAPFATAAGDATVQIDEPLVPVECAGVPGQDACETSVDFTSEGFPAGTAYLVASSDSFEGPWTLSSELPPPSSGSAPEDREAAVELPTAGESAPPPSPLVVAVLVYLDALPQEAPGEVAELAELAPDVAYVSRELEVVVASP
jgi:hypothetical protein